MLGSHEALEEILGRLVAGRVSERVSLERAAGRVLATRVVSDVDLPPFEKSAMDGYAVHSTDFAPEKAPDGERTLPIVGESRAGAPLGLDVPAGACAAIYTGAEVPVGCDAVVMVERTESQDRADGEGRALVTLRDTPRSMQNVCKRGQDLRTGQEVLAPGRRLRDVDLALLAAVGAEPVEVLRRPRVAVLTSGDELVPPDEMPGLGQIREGNTLHLAAMSERAGAQLVQRGVVADDPAALASTFGAALAECDVLVTTGGVSMGRYDLVGAALESLGVEPVFHRVAIKPGKPLWFGMHGNVPVFALPGNPVSCLVNHALFVRPALRFLGGEDLQAAPEFVGRGRWLGKATKPNTREQFLPVRAGVGADGVVELEPVRWNGSADVVGISLAEALAVVPPEVSLGNGELCDWRPLA